MAGARAWTADDRTGGPIDEIFAGLRGEFRDLEIERLVGTYPADDDNVFWLSLGPSPRFRGAESVQVDTGNHGRPPFLLEGERQRGEYVETIDPPEALAILVNWLRRRAGGTSAAGH
jgi:hypothetical protein